MPVRTGREGGDPAMHCDRGPLPHTCLGGWVEGGAPATCHCGQTGGKGAPCHMPLWADGGEGAPLPHAIVGGWGGGGALATCH